MESDRYKIMAAFAAIYLIWGSTYLAIRFAIESLPPFLMSGVRFGIAGALLYGWTALRGEPAPTARQWGTATLIGALLLLGGNGGVVLAEQRGVASGLAALLVATVPMWMVLLDWKSRGRIYPGAQILAGLFLGFFGVALLVAQNAGLREPLDPLGVAALFAASISWAVGSIHSRGADLPASVVQATAMELIGGGLCLCLAGVAAGETWHLSSFSLETRSVASFLYLIVFGSLIGYSAYIYLLKVSTPAKVSTYAFVNPAIAMFLGWGLGNESLTGGALLAAAVIISSVAIITTRREPSGNP